MTEESSQNSGSVIDEIKALGAKVLADIAAMKAEHESTALAIKEEFMDAAHELLGQLEDKAKALIPQDIGTLVTSAAETLFVPHVLDEIAELPDDIGAQTLVTLAVALVKRAVKIDENSKVNFESQYNQ